MRSAVGSRAATAAILLLGSSGCVIGSTSEDGVRCLAALRGAVSRTTTRPDGSVVFETCEAGRLLALPRSDRP